eukprot:UN01442
MLRQKNVKAPKANKAHPKKAKVQRVQKRNISINKFNKLVKTKKRLMVEIPVTPEIKEVGTLSAKTAFDIDTQVVQFTHPLPHVDVANHPLLHKPKLFDPKQCFAIIDVNGAQHKVTKDDQLMVSHLRDVEVGEQLAFEHVYLLASRDYTVMGKPWVPNVTVLATVEEHTMLSPVTVWKYKRRTGERNLNRHRDVVTILRIDDITIDDEAIIPNVNPLDTVQVNVLKPTDTTQV